jgi:hypothetical protein
LDVPKKILERIPEKKSKIRSPEGNLNILKKKRNVDCRKTNLRRNTSRED